MKIRYSVVLLSVIQKCTSSKINNKLDDVCKSAYQIHTGIGWWNQVNTTDPNDLLSYVVIGARPGNELIKCSLIKDDMFVTMLKQMWRIYIDHSAASHTSNIITFIRLLGYCCWYRKGYSCFKTTTCYKVNSLVNSTYSYHVTAVQPL